MILGQDAMGSGEICLDGVAMEGSVSAELNHGPRPSRAGPGEPPRYLWVSKLYAVNLAVL